MIDLHLRNAARTAAIAVLALLGLQIAPLMAAAAVDDQSAKLVGRYRLEGVRETASALAIRDDGRFAFELSYGAVDQSASGRWSVGDGTLRLEADKLPPPTLSWGSAKPDIDSTSGYANGKLLALLIRVETPSMGLTWSDISVTARFSNGKSRSGLTGSNGYLGFLSRDDDPEWKGAVVRSIAVAYPKANVASVTFAIDSKVTRTAVVRFDPGSMVAAPFDRLDFKIVSGADQRPMLTETIRGWRYQRDR